MVLCLWFLIPNDRTLIFQIWNLLSENVKFFNFAIQQCILFIWMKFSKKYIIDKKFKLWKSNWKYKHVI